MRLKAMKTEVVWCASSHRQQISPNASLRSCSDTVKPLETTKCASSVTCVQLGLCVADCGQLFWVSSPPVGKKKEGKKGKGKGETREE